MHGWWTLIDGGPPSAVSTAWIEMVQLMPAEKSQQCEYFIGIMLMPRFFHLFSALKDATAAFRASTSELVASFSQIAGML